MESAAWLIWQTIMQTIWRNRQNTETKVKEASHLLLELVNDVLDMSKLESDEVVLEEIPFNLSSIYREVLVVIEQMAAEQNIRIVWEKKEITHRNFIGSPGYVKRVMMNILSNAVKYNRENGQYLYQLPGTSIRTAGNDNDGICLPGYRNRNDR